MTAQHKTTTARFALASAGLLGASSAAWAGVPMPMTTGVHTMARVTQTAPGFSYDSGELDSSALFESTLSQASRTFASATISSDSVAEFGTLSNSMSFTGPLDGFDGNRVVRAFGESGFHDDTVTYTAPGLEAGDTVTLTAIFSLDIDLVLEFAESLSGDGFGAQSFAYSFMLDIAGSSIAFEGEFFNRDQGIKVTSGDYTPGLVEFDVEVPVGEAFSITARLDTEYEARASNSAFSGLFSTIGENPNFELFRFEGLGEEGRLTSDKGGLYASAPVPSPASTALCALSLALAGVRRKRSH